MQVKGEWKEALQCCQDAQALATHLPAGADAFFRMGMLYYERDMGLEDKYFAIVSGWTHKHPAHCHVWETVLEAHFIPGSHFCCLCVCFTMT
jgi:hypothetical protein